MEQSEEDLDLPPRLVEDLRGLYGLPRAVPAMRDRAILAAARRSVQRRWWRMAVPLGIAAAVALAAGIFWHPWGRPEGSAVVAAAYTPTGDIRDAFYVARQLKAHQALEAGWDANHDGVVDEKDVQLLALAAVRVAPEGAVR